MHSLQSTKVLSKIATSRMSPAVPPPCRWTLVASPWKWRKVLLSIVTPRITVPEELPLSAPRVIASASSRLAPLSKTLPVTRTFTICCGPEERPVTLGWPTRREIPRFRWRTLTTRRPRMVTQDAWTPSAG